MGIFVRNDLVTHADHGDVRYFMIGREIVDGKMIYSAAKSVAFSDTFAPDVVFGPAEKFTLVEPTERSSLRHAAERVRMFLAARSQARNVPAVIHSVVREDGELPLTVADLEALVRSVLGPDAVTRVEPPRRDNSELRAAVDGLRAAGIDISMPEED